MYPPYLNIIRYYKVTAVPVINCSNAHHLLRLGRLVNFIGEEIQYHVDLAGLRTNHMLNNPKNAYKC